MDNKYTQYANDVLDGKVVAGKLVKLACERYLSYFDRPDLYFDTDKADRPVRFISKLKHSTGKFAGKPFKLQPWQEFLVYAMFGWYRKSDNTRLVRNTYVQVSRKCGKTALAAAISLYELIADDEYGAEIDVVSPSRDQSRICFDAAKNYMESINKGNIFTYKYGTIFFNAKKSKLRVMSSDSKYGDGYNPSFAVVDEYHAHENNDLPNLLISGMGMRTQPMVMYITTAGFDLYSECKKYRDMCEEILYDKKQDDSVFALIYELDKGDDWKDETVWQKAVPSLDITVSKDYLRSQVNLALNNTSLETNVKTKNLNMWVQSKKTWLSNDLVLEHSEDFSLEKFTGSYCYIGIDLAAISDFTSISALIPFENKLYFKTWVFLPEETVETSVNSSLYQRWKREGKILCTPGNVTDYDYILGKVKAINDICPVFCIAYDSWNATQFAINATAEGYSMEPYSQSLGSFNKPTKEFERLLKKGNIVIDNNEVVRYCFSNATIKSDHNDNVKPVKSGSESNKIDCVISMIEALGIMLQQPHADNEIFFV